MISVHRPSLYALVAGEVDVLHATVDRFVFKGMPRLNRQYWLRPGPEIVHLSQNLLLIIWKNSC